MTNIEFYRASALQQGIQTMNIKYMGIIRIGDKWQGCIKNIFYFPSLPENFGDHLELPLC